MGVTTSPDVMEGATHEPAVTSRVPIETPVFTVRTAGPEEERLLSRGDVYSAALAFLDGRIDIQGDIFAALRELTAKAGGGLRQWYYTALARLWSVRPERWHQSRAR